MENQSELYGGFDYLRRLDNILCEFNKSLISGELEEANNFIELYNQELDSYMSVEERAEIEKLKDNLKKLRQGYRDESEENENKLERNSNLNIFGVKRRRVVLPQNNFERYKIEIINLRLFLQRIAKKSGLIMSDKPDPRRALLGGNKKDESD